VNMRWMGVKTFRHGVLYIIRDHIVSFMGAFVEGVLHPSFTMQHFSKPFISISFIMVQTLSAMCKEIKGALQCHLKLEYIECHIQWKFKDTANAFPHQVGDLLIIYFFKGPLFLWRNISFLSGPKGEHLGG
jgi:hypothetical protein